MRIPILKSMFVIVAVATSSTAHAAFTLIDDFEALALGNLDNQGNWTTTLGSQTSTTSRQITADPEDAGNQVLRVDVHNTTGSGSGQLDSYIPLGAGLADGTTGTIFFRMRGSSPVMDLVFGPSESATPGGWGAYRAQSRFSNGGIDGRFDTAYEEVDTYTNNAWYNIWSVIDNSNDTWTMYASQGSAAAGMSHTGGILNAPTATLQTLLLRQSGGHFAAGYIDDIHFDASGANLTNPIIPEPSSVLLAGACCMLVGASRRRQ